MKFILKPALMIFIFANVVQAQTSSVNLSFSELTNYVAQAEKADPYSIKKLIIKKDVSFKNGIVILNVSDNCGQGLCKNYVFTKNALGHFDFAGNIEGLFEESKESPTNPDFPEIITKTKSASEFELLKWSYNSAKRKYENK